MTKHRLMLAAVAAALLTGTLSGAQAQTVISSSQSNAVDTVTTGDITILAGGSISVKSSQPALTIETSNSVLSAGSISNNNTAQAIGVEINTVNGDLFSPGGLTNVGGITLSGDGTYKSGLTIAGGRTFFGPITLSEVSVLSGAIVNATNAAVGSQSSIIVQGDSSNAIFFAQGTTLDGAMSIGGILNMTPSKNSKGSGATLVDLQGNLQGNLVLDNAANLVNIGSTARGVGVLGPISKCVDNSGLGYTCGTTSTVIGGTALGNVGAFVNAGSITVLGTNQPNAKGGNPESGSAVVIANSIDGGFLNNGPSTSNGTTPTATISGNGTLVGGVLYPVVLIDPSQSITSTNVSIRGPVTLGIVPTSIDPVDGGLYSFINRGSIGAQTIDADLGAAAVVITGASTANFTSLTGGLLNTGTISATAVTSVNTDSATQAGALTIGSYATVPKIVISGEVASSNSNTPGVVSATVLGPGGGTATAVDIGNLATVPEIDVLAHGTISASIQSSTTSPTGDFASQKTPFEQISYGILDQSGTLTKINNAGVIAALNTQQTPAADAVVINNAHAVDLLASSTGLATINNSGTIEGDIYFGSGGGGNTLNIGNTGSSGTLANPATGVTNTPYDYATVSAFTISTSSGYAPSTQANVVSFGSGTGNKLVIGGFGYANSIIVGAADGLDVTVYSNGQLFVANTSTTGPANVHNFDIEGGLLGLTISQETSTATPVVLAGTGGTATIGPDARIGLQFGGFIAAPDPSNPTPQKITLISAPTIVMTQQTLADDNQALSQQIPFLFESTATPLSLPTPAAGINSTLVLTLTPRSLGATNADGTPGLNLSGAALKLFPYTAAALGNDPQLGAAIASSLTVYKSSATGAASGINIAASQQEAQQVFSQFAPDVSGDSREIAIMLTDQATGPVAARQRLLRSYANQGGGLTLWGQEFSGMINNKGRFDGEGDLTGYKDHGYGFAVGMDGGSAQNGWYGGAISFYSGDANETAPRATKTEEEWYMLTGYTDWRGRHLFLDTQASLAYGTFLSNRQIVAGNLGRLATGKSAGLMGALGLTTGVAMNYKSLLIMPQISLDGLTMRQEGYTEVNGGDGFDLQVAPYYASSLRAFLGADVRGDFDLSLFNLSPDLRIGYRYDFLGDPLKLKAGFASTGGISTAGNTFTFTGPDPDSGNFLVGLGLAAGTDTWSLGANYDWMRGSNGSTTQVGIISLLGRI